MRLTLVRHGETEHNRENITLGRADVHLNPRGLLQARAIAASYTRPPSAIYASPLRRCADTADAIAAATSVPVTIDERLIEMDVGDLEHLTRDDLRKRHGAFLRDWMGEAAADARMPGGETLTEVQDRAWHAVERMRQDHPDGEVVAVTHNFVILAVACRALGLPLGSFRRLRATVGSKAIIDIGPASPTLISWNDISHLRDRGLD